MKNVFAHTRMYIFRGILTIIPICLCILAIQLLYILIDKKVMDFLDHFVNIRQIPGFGIFLVLVVLYAVGLITSNVIGRRIFHLIEQFSKRIPIAKTIYQIAKEFSDKLSINSYKQSFKKVILIDWNQEGLWVIGFVVGQIKDEQTNEEMLCVYMPQVPNPIMGFVLVVKESRTVSLDWTVEAALKAVVSGGIISPTKM